MLSIMMTVESTTMPKSTAPIEMRFAGVPVATIPQNAARSASGMLSAVMSAARPCPEEEDEDDRHEHHADDDVLEDRVRRERDEVAAVVVRDDLHAGRQEVVRPDELDALVDALQRRRRLAAVAHQHGALDDVVVVVVADDAEPRRVADLDGRDVAHADRDARRARRPRWPRCRGRSLTRPTPRIVYACSPSVRRWPPTFWFELWIALMS